MGEIAPQRQELADNLVRLETKFRRSTDWRVQFRERPFMFPGLVFGTGMILSMLIPGRHRHG